MQPLAINFVSPVVYYVGLVLTAFALVLELFSFVHCVVQKREAFPAIGTLSKGLWLALTGGGAVLTLVLGAGATSIFGLIGLIAAAVYILDVRPGLRDLKEGGTSW